MSDAESAPLDKDASRRRNRRRRGAKGTPQASARAETRGGKNSGGASRRSSGRGRERATNGGDGPVFAAIDLGTNNCRLLIARPNSKTPHQPFTVIDAFSRIVRLGEGLGQTGVLSEDAMERTVAALNICAGKITKQKAGRVDAVATEACRQAANYGEFVERVERATGVKLRLISGQEEAAIGLAGCASLLDSSTPRALVFDIGGGSTEVSWIDTTTERPRVLASRSVPLGVVTLAEKHGDGLELSDDDFETIARNTRRAFKQFSKRHGIVDAIKRGEVQMVGTSGTITTVAGLHLNLPSYDRSKVDGMRLTVRDVQAVIGDLRTRDNDSRAMLGCIGRGRSDLVLPGCAVLDGLTTLWSVPTLSVADRGLREGMLLRMMQGKMPGKRRRPRRRPRRGKPDNGPENSPKNSTENSTGAHGSEPTSAAPPTPVQSLAQGD